MAQVRYKDVVELQLEPYEADVLYDALSRLDIEANTGPVGWALYKIREALNDAGIDGQGREVIIKVACEGEVDE